MTLDPVAGSPLSTLSHRAPSLLPRGPLSLRPPLPVRSKAGSAPPVAFQQAFLHPYTHSTWIEPFPFSPPHLTSPSSISPPAGSSLSTYPPVSHLALFASARRHPWFLQIQWVCDSPGAIQGRIYTAGGFPAAFLATLTSPSSLCPAAGFALSSFPHRAPSLLHPVPLSLPLSPVSPRR
uniref:Uncharacterized protein n=1 Tax=Ananas comosus var. bracteatus TaxID=296719 RepID=A0A6V7NSJ1_ANACO|nr:unnamed protein product [Ananas comosus var. bracteatus]